tara:strand:- start:998 stop:2536 length:1539 start_codon:yes stop_codon:yes gene_type:complete
MAINSEVFLGSGASLMFVPELDFYVKPSANPATDDTSVAFHSDITWAKLVTNLYTGCTLELRNASNNFISSHKVTSNTYNTLHFTPKVTATGTLTNYYYILKGFAAPLPAPDGSGHARLCADNWLGLVESATFPNIDIEMRQMNNQLGGTRNFSHQFKGIETTSGGNLGLVLTHPCWLYYFLGKAGTVTPHTDLITANTGLNSDVRASSTNGLFIDNGAHLAQGPIFYRSIGDKVVPPLMKGADAYGSMDLVALPTLANKLITYAFTEANGVSLPSFSLEQNLSKLEDSDAYVDSTETNESHNFVRIARGNRVNTLTLTANENEEVKMTLDLNSSTIDTPTTDYTYQGRRGVTADSSLFNNNASQDSYNEPYFFTDGVISIYGQTFLKIQSFSLTMNNNLMDKRYVGMANKKVKDSIPAQRTYEISFSALVTDSKLFNELRQAGENTSNDMTLTFTKANNTNETFNITFQNYITNSANWTIPEDRGPVTVDMTVNPRTMSSCTATTNWVLQG